MSSIGLCQGQVLLDDFNRANTTAPSIPGGWTQLSLGTNNGHIDSHTLKIESNSNQANLVYKDVSSLYNTTFSENTQLLTWAINMHQTAADPSGFNNNNYGIGFILGVLFKPTIFGEIPGVNPFGYAVVLGEPNTPNVYNRVRLVHIDGDIGNNAIKDIISSGTYDYANEYLSIKVTYNPNGDKWSLYVESDPDKFPQSDPYLTTNVIATDVINNEYVNENLHYLGMDWHHSNSPTEFAIFDEVYIPYNFNSFFRSVQSGNWNDTDTWQMSADNVNWVPAMVTPTQLADTITIRNAHTVQITTEVSIDQTVVASGATLWLVNPNPTFTLQNGTGDDLEIQSGGVYVHGTSATVPGGTGNLRMRSGSTLRVDKNASGQADWYATNENSPFQSRMIWENGSTFQWNTVQPFSTDNMTFFPNVTSEVPILKITKNLSVGSSNPTIIRGILEADANVAWSGAGAKSFRNGLRGSGDITQEASSGPFQITGPSAELSGAGNLVLYASGLRIQATTVNSPSAKTITTAVPSTVTLEGGNSQQIGGSGALTFGAAIDLNVQNNVSLLGNMVINGTLSFANGILQTKAHTITLGENALLNETETARAWGTLTTTHTLAQGVNDNFGGLGLEILAQGASPGATTVSRVTGPTAVRTDGGGNQSIQRYFTILPTTDAGLDATLVFHYFDTEVVANDASLILFRSVNNGDNWIDEQGEADPILNTILRFGISTFAHQWTAADANEPLPVYLRSFSGYRAGNGIRLEWSTHTEINGDGFEVQRSATLKDFVAIGYVKAAQPPQAVNHYTFTDENYLLSGYYRLKQLDLDGQYEYSKPIFVEGSSSHTLDNLLLYPNPTQGKIYLSLPDITEAHFILRSSKGIPLAVFVAFPIQADAQVSEILLRLPAGLYFLQTSQGQVTYQNKIVKY
jgi:hypothetical protein